MYGKSYSRYVIIQGTKKALRETRATFSVALIIYFSIANIGRIFEMAKFFREKITRSDSISHIAVPA
jgi:hypothetical protein